MCHWSLPVDNISSWFSDSSTGHVKIVVGGWNSVDKQFLMSIILRLYVSEDKINKPYIAPHLSTTGGFEGHSE